MHTVLTTVLVTICSIVVGQNAQSIRETELPGQQWRLESSDANAALVNTEFLAASSELPEGCQYLELEAGQGTYAYLALPMPPAALIDELKISLPLRASRPGMQLYVRVILPRSANPNTGRPITTLLPGPFYEEADRWQSLQLGQLRQLLEKQLFALRAEFGPQVDPRGAYLDALVINAYTGPGKTKLWIGRPQLQGFVISPFAQTSAATPAISSQTDADKVRQTSSEESLPASHHKVHQVEMAGAVLIVDGRPFFPRILQHRGEPLELVKQLGFNCVWLSQPPDRELVQAAQEQDLWLVCPPPLELDQYPPDAASVFARVIAWDLGSAIYAESLPQLRRRAEQIRDWCATVGLGKRPLVCRPETGLRAASRIADILVFGRRTAGTTLSVNDMCQWIRQQSQIARPGTPIWTSVATQYPQELLSQMAAVGAPTKDDAIPYDNLRLAVMAALSAGPRGMVFSSDRRLDTNTPADRIRRLSLQLINLELSLAEPWLAAGTVVADIMPDNPVGEFSWLDGTILRTDRARLVILRHLGNDATPVVQYPAIAPTFVAPGIPEAYHAYWLLPGEMRPVRHKRVTTGVRVQLDEPAVTAMVMLTGDPLAMTTLSRQTARIGSPAAHLAVQLASETLQQWLEIKQQLQVPQITPIAARQEQLSQLVQKAQDSLNSGQWATAYLSAEAILRLVRDDQLHVYQRLSTSDSQLKVNPALLAPQFFAWHGRFAVPPADGENVLVGGNFEDLSALTSNGWRHWQHGQQQATVQVELSPQAAFSGKYGLRIVSAPTESASAAEAPVAWIFTPFVPVKPNTIVQIQGRIRINQQLSGGVDGFLVMDSLGGVPLALRCRKTEGWQPFVLYRATGSAKQIQVTLALWGFGEVMLDDLRILQQ